MAKTVTLEDQEWTQLVAIIANATGFQTVSKLFNQLAAQEQTANLDANYQVPQASASTVAQDYNDFAKATRGDGLDPDPPRLVPRR